MRLSPLGLAGLVLLAGCSTASKSASHTRATPTARPDVQYFPTATPGGKPRPTAVKGVTLPAPPGLKTATPTARVHFPASAYTAQVFGTVTQRKTGKPIAGALVDVADGQKTVRTDAAGRYAIAFPARAAASIQVRKQGFQCGLAMGTLKPAQKVRKDWVCDKTNPSHPVPPPFPSLLGTPRPGAHSGAPPPAPPKS
jgi:hypothetical protein